MEPILKSYYNRFKESFEIDTKDNNAGNQQRKEAAAFEKFINHVMFSIDDPDAFVSDLDMLDTVCVGGGQDTGIDGIGVRINGRLVATKEDVQQLLEISKKIDIEFVFIQSKMQEHFDSSEFNTAGLGVKDFFSKQPKLPCNDAVNDFRALKDYLYEDEDVLKKIQHNPSVNFYYVAMGPTPVDEHFKGVKRMIEDELRNNTGCYFEDVRVELVGGKQILAYCRELENNFTVQLNTNDIIPLTVPGNDRIKKAYIFTCYAREFMKILKKDDGTIRRSLFNDNVRDYLGAKGSVNCEIKETISTSPEMFSLCNNGITIVCSEFDQIKDKLVKIENPQIVNGCQTSNTLFENSSGAGFDKVQLVVRIICTEDVDITNRVVRGTNKQNQVLDEAFEATKPYHQNLELYFNSIQDGLARLYYERRSKQYSFNPLIKKYQIVNLRILTQTFVAVFLDSPHIAHRHEAKLLEEFCQEPRRIYTEKHNPIVYYTCATLWYYFEKAFRDGLVDKRYKTYKAHLYLIFRELVCGHPSTLLGNKMEAYCNRFMDALKKPETKDYLVKTVEFFNRMTKEWVKTGGSKYGIKDSKSFEDLLIKSLSDRTGSVSTAKTKEEPEDERENGVIINLVYHNDDHWYAFIKSEDEGENLYFDKRNYTGEVRRIIVGERVSFVRKKRSDKEGKKLYADVVRISY